MTGVAVLGALWPLSRRRSRADGEAHAIAFHKAQLAEIDRDVERGQLPAAEAAGARAEAARRLIAASEAAKAPGADDARSSIRRRAAALIVIVLIPAARSASIFASAARPAGSAAVCAGRGIGAP